MLTTFISRYGSIWTPKAKFLSFYIKEFFLVQSPCFCEKCLFEWTIKKYFGL